ncbi:uncharacterized protein KNAG_0D01280 [Huiozyma naganishii CBS 8797]|uniref:Uncharacterized protein n=1 Tax=Huiozyma naganishii (strain ATCC MYA-139 / BCRC 22969 / CBS 8797 / KCTC 17520 / NBRC 10181 / NCYC 3082 / Yp74L-3) TaxID=1071383 RepID=J7R4V7_HUIN7|nr:hypothetical protein KNAG_0D01280 [Kazachstania naganishii CBS 8797]CCK69880.1 hypothetical protein KNAG_0D01280 [Kazachstania naganishii CBS 8797]
MNYPFEELQNNYRLAAVVKNKLHSCTTGCKRKGFDLREIVCHANLLDSILDNIDVLKYRYVSQQRGTPGRTAPLLTSVASSSTEPMYVYNPLPLRKHQTAYDDAATEDDDDEDCEKYYQYDSGSDSNCDGEGSHEQSLNEEESIYNDDLITAPSMVPRSPSPSSSSTDDDIEDTEVAATQDKSPPTECVLSKPLAAAVITAMDNSNSRSSLYYRLRS